MKIKVCVAAEKLPDFMSWLIMTCTGYEASHALIAYKGRLYHCDDKGVGDNCFAEFCSTHHINDGVDVELNCTEEEFLAWHKKLDSVEYSHSQWLGFLGKIFKKIVSNKRKSAICTEYVAWCLNDLAGFTCFDDSEFLKPKELMSKIKLELIRMAK